MSFWVCRKKQCFLKDRLQMTQLKRKIQCLKKILSSTGDSKVQIIISHGGLLTVQEAIYHEKPLLTIPIDITQHRNSQRSFALGFSESINIHNFSSTEIIVKIRMLAENPLYLVNVRKASKMLKSRQTTAKQTAIYWIEKVLEHDGLSHLKCESRKLSFYKLYMLDITLIIAVIMLIYILIMQYHFINEWIVNRERKREKGVKDEDKVMNERDKLKNE
jgi:UDP-glucoronosyl and UDP-glucosyl transferase